MKMMPVDQAERSSLDTASGPMKWGEGWRRAVDEFVVTLDRKGYSRYTLRDYRTDVMRLGAALVLRPEELGRQHLAQADRRHIVEGLPLSARRRRQSAYQRFLEFLERRRTADGATPLRGPEVLHAAVAEPFLDRVLVALVYLGGFRLVEIAQLEGRDIRLRKGVITTRLGYRIVPVHPVLADLLREMRHHAPLAAYRPVIPGLNGFAANARTLHSRFHRLTRRLGFDDLKPDGLRREVSIHLVGLGTPPGLVKAFLGKDRGRPVAPRQGRYVDLGCLAGRIRTIPV